MITDDHEYERARSELDQMEQFLSRVEQEQPQGELVGYTKAGIRKMIARLHEELGEWEASAAKRAVAATT